MKTSYFEKLGINTSLLGFGCMRFPTKTDGTIDEIQSEAMLDKAIAEGVTYIDTAYPYHNGESESFVGKVLKKYNRNQFTIATKLPVWKVNKKEDVRVYFYEQLNKLQVDYVDFYLLHALDNDKWDLLLKQGVLEEVEALQREGKIRFLGFSFHDEYNVFEKIITYRNWDFCQIQYNYIDTQIQAGDKGYALAEKLGIPLIIMEPIKGGNLANLPEDIAKYFKSYNPDKTLSSWALRWVASHSNVKVILSGMSNMEHVVDNLDTFNNFSELNDEEMECVRKVTDIILSRTKNGCTGCEYCMPCPHGVNIPRNFKIWNDFAIYGNENQAVRRYWKDMPATERADMCQECGACEPLCPQSIKIINDLRRVNVEIPRE
jgi:uncharacterized protein